MRDCVGIIAGAGQFPRLVAEDVRRMGHSVVICGFEGHTDPALAAFADAFTLLHLGQFNKVIAFFRRHGATTLCLAGAINKPRALDLRPDFRAVRLLFSLRGKGDDALLRVILADLEAEGFTVAAPSSFVPGLAAPAGLITLTRPTDDVLAALAFGWPVADALGRFDIGQCLVVREGMVVAVECLEGTDATLRRAGQLGGAGCVAIKRAKPGQEERVDLPAVGLETVRVLVDNHYAGLVIETGKTLFFDRDEAVRLADAHGLCILGCDAEGRLPALY